MAPTGTPSFRVALTGGIASGKSTVAEAFAALGVPVIDTDAIAHELTAPGMPAVRRIAEALGPDVLDAHGNLDRRRLRDRIFADPAQRARLEAVLHPLILAETDRRCALAAGDYQIVVVPLLFEAGLEGRFDRVLVVDAPESARIERLRARDGETAEGAARILAAQTSRAQRLARADDVIVNDGTPADLAARVAALHRYYVEHAAAIKN
jgi:dephospho-CoA kinase